MGRFRFPCPMRWSDMDAYGHVNNVVFLTYLEEARVEMFAQLANETPRSEVRHDGAGRDADGLLEGGVVVAHNSIDYKRPLVHRTEPVPIDIWVSRIGGASFDLTCEVHDEGGVVYARGMTTMVTYDFKAGTPRRLYAHERDFLLRYLEEDADADRRPAT
jgi:acyl-CoA thioester hydrolase